MILGRRFRKWRTNLDDGEKEKLKQKTEKYGHVCGALGFLLVSLGIYGYESHVEETPITKRRRFVALTKNQMDVIVEQEFEELLKENRADILPNSHPAYGKIARIAQRIIASNRDIEGLSKKNWTITVIDSDVKNAFVLPNGNIFVYTGMLDVCSNEDQFAVILAHEMAHAILNHGAEGLSHANLISCLLIIPLAVLWSLFPNDGIALIADQVFNTIAKIIMDLPHSRAIESEADVVGLDLIAKACFDVREAPAFWRKMDFLTFMSKDEVEIPEFLSTHPSNNNRWFQLKKRIPSALSQRENCQCSRLQGPDPDIAMAMSIAGEKSKLYRTIAPVTKTRLTYRDA